MSVLVRSMDAIMPQESNGELCILWDRRGKGRRQYMKMGINPGRGECGVKCRAECQCPAQGSQSSVWQVVKQHR